MFVLERVLAKPSTTDTAFLHEVSSARFCATEARNALCDILVQLVMIVEGQLLTCAVISKCNPQDN